MGIIGVVAAITMPTLMNKTKNKELHTAFLKTYSELNQIAQRFVADNGVSVSEATLNNSFGIWNIAHYFNGSKSVVSSSMGIEDENGNFIPYYNMKTIDGKKYSGGKNTWNSDSSFICDNSSYQNTMSGALYILNNVLDITGPNGPVICVDVNGKKGPNRYGLDYFLFIFTVDGRVLPMGMPHQKNPPACNSASGSCRNFANTGSQYCAITNNIAKNTSCAYYALTDTHPTKEGKNYGRIF